jgi:Na+/phosphate symporter
MTTTRIAFMLLAAALALLGLFTAAAAQEVGLVVFGWGLFLFGVGFCLSRVKRTCDEADGLVPRG